MLALYCPAAQGAQVVELAAAAKVPVAQPTQVIAPVWAWYLPSTQGAQAGWPEPIWDWPATQLVQATTDPELGSAFPGGQGVQVGDAAARA